MRLKNRTSLLLGFGHEAAHGLIDLMGGFWTELARLCDLASQERMFLALPKIHGPDILSHAPASDHDTSEAARRGSPRVRSCPAFEGDVTIESSRTQECRIEYVRPVSSCEHDDRLMAGESIELGEDLTGAVRLPGQDVDLDVALFQQRQKVGIADGRNSGGDARDRRAGWANNRRFAEISSALNVT